MAARKRVAERYSYANLRQTLAKALASLGTRGNVSSRDLESSRKETAVV